MRRVLLIGISVAAVVGCGTTPAPVLPPTPAPIQLTTARAQREVVPLAARQLLASGYEIATSDASGGILVARREKPAKEIGADVVCSYRGGSLLAASRLVAFTVSVNALPGDSTMVQITNSVRSFDKPGQSAMLRLPESTTDCVSSGAVERRIADALK